MFISLLCKTFFPNFSHFSSLHILGTYLSGFFLMEHADINNSIDAFKSVLDKSMKIVGFTGAGISTESGISDYRSKGGIWDKFQPVYFEEFISDEKKRLLYWQRKQELWKDLSTASPNTGHMFFKELYDEGQARRTHHTEYRRSS